MNPSQITTDIINYLLDTFPELQSKPKEDREILAAMIYDIINTKE